MPPEYSRRVTNHTLIYSLKGKMEFAVLLFGTLKDAAETDRISVKIPTSTTANVASLLEQCGKQHPKIARWLPHVRVAVNLEYSSLDKELSAGDEIALIPPVAGG